MCRRKPAAQWTLYAYANTDLVIDINGYYAPPGDLQGNTALGFRALQSNTTGTANTASGNLALSSNTTGKENTANGNLALSANTTGSYNTAIGEEALQNNTTGDLNTANGDAALFANTTGSGNTANGTQAPAEQYYREHKHGERLCGAEQQHHRGPQHGAVPRAAEQYYRDQEHGERLWGAEQQHHRGGNTASGYAALANNTGGNDNIAIGLPPASTSRQATT